MKYKLLIILLLGFGIEVHAQTTFVGWSGACTGNAPTCKVTMNGNQTVTATFSDNTSNTLQVNITGTGSVTSNPSGISCPSTCTATYATGVPVILTASPGTGYKFAGWGGVCSGLGNCNVTMNGNQLVTATFTSTAAPNAPTQLKGNVNLLGAAGIF